MNPWQLLKLEWKRFSPNATCRVLAALYVVSFALMFLLAHLLGENFKMTANGVTSHPTRDLFLYPKIWQVLAWIGSWANTYLVGFMGLFVITSEFGNRTLRQSVIFGLSRREAALSKMSLAVAVASAASAWYVVLGLAGSIFWGAGPSLPPPSVFAGFFLQVLGYYLLGTVAGLLIRQTALAMLAYFAYVLFLETAGRWIFYFAVEKSRLPLFLPDSVFAGLAPLPAESVGKWLPALTLHESLVMALVYAALLALLVFRRLGKADL